MQVKKSSILLYITSLLLAISPMAVRGQAFSSVLNPAVPGECEFAGQKIDLDRPDMAERLDRELTAMVYTHGNTLLQIKRANRYFPMLDSILRANGVPSDMLYLACIESYLNPLAVSPAKAAGMWQFMPATGKQYGLEVNDYVDERYDPEKSTVAACRYLKDAKAKYSNWENVAASYNAGMGRITNELKAQNVDSAYDLWLADETMRYIYRLLAAKIIMEDPVAYGFCLTDDQLYQPYDYQIIEVNTPVADWAQWAKEHGSTYYEVRSHNPWIRAKSLPNASGKTYRVKIPTAEASSRKNRELKTFNPNWTISQ